MSKQDGRSRQVSAPGLDSSTAPILHVDLDAFFASVELLDHPELVHRPVVVAGRSARSVVTAANYPARTFGVRSAMPLSVALRKCPQAVVLPPHYEKYQAYSAQVMAIFDDMTPHVERLGIDEAFLDVAGARTLLGPPANVAEHIRARVFTETGLRCSVGAAATKFVAKVASGRAKPDGLLVVPQARTLEFLHPLPVSALWGVGAVTEQALTSRGLRTVGDVAAAPLPLLQRAVGEAAAHKLSALARGDDPRPVTARAEEKSIGHEVTFDTDITDAQVLQRELLRLSTLVAARMRAAGAEASTIAIKMRYADFTTITRSRTIPEPTDLARRIYSEAIELYSALGAHRSVRLIGVRAENLSAPGGASLALWDTDEEWRGAERAVEEVQHRFGSGTVAPASLLRPAPRPQSRGSGGSATK